MTLNQFFLSFNVSYPTAATGLCLFSLFQTEVELGDRLWGLGEIIDWLIRCQLSNASQVEELSGATITCRARKGSRVGAGRGREPSDLSGGSYFSLLASL